MGMLTEAVLVAFLPARPQVYRTRLSVRHYIVRVRHYVVRG